MQHYWSLEEVQLRDVWLTIGSFDGVHRGHQEVVRHLTSGAHALGLPAVVLTFFPHPAVVLGKRQGAFYLTTPEERALLLEQLGVDVVITHPFNHQVATTSAIDFLTSLHAHLRMSRLLVGPNFALGRNREGDLLALQRLGQHLAYTLQVLPQITNGGEVVSSSRVRDELVVGNLQAANQLLGRPYQLTGTVVPGDQRGRMIGIPTANLAIWPERLIPKAGVYICQAHLGEGILGAVSNIGVRPTFESHSVTPRVETHLLDFSGDIYGQEIKLDLLARLRDEQRFPSLAALIEQIQRDIAQARDFLAQINENEPG
jgi:riboflavin kinase/FMN adenylyltransferase